MYTDSYLSGRGDFSGRERDAINTKKVGTLHLGPDSITQFSWAEKERMVPKGKLRPHARLEYSQEWKKRLYRGGRRGNTHLGNPGRRENGLDSCRAR